MQGYGKGGDRDGQKREKGGKKVRKRKDYKGTKGEFEVLQNCLEQRDAVNRISNENSSFDRRLGRS